MRKENWSICINGRTKRYKFWLAWCAGLEDIHEIRTHAELCGSVHLIKPYMYSFGTSCFRILLFWHCLPNKTVGLEGLTSTLLRELEDFVDFARFSFWCVFLVTTWLESLVLTWSLRNLPKTVGQLFGEWKTSPAKSIGFRNQLLSTENRRCQRNASLISWEANSFFLRYALNKGLHKVDRGISYFINMKNFSYALQVKFITESNQAGVLMTAQYLTNRITIVWFLRETIEYLGVPMVLLEWFPRRGFHGSLLQNPLVLC